MMNPKSLKLAMLTLLVAVALVGQAAAQTQRWYLADIIGAGDELDPYRPDLPPGVSYSAVFPPVDAQGQFVRNTCLVLVKTANHATVRARKGTDPLPDMPLDARISAIERVASQAMDAASTRRGLNVEWSNPDGFRDVIRSLGRQISGNQQFDENEMNVN